METVLKSLLKKLDIEFKTYSLVNNHGLEYDTDKYSIDIRHWLNAYGASVDHWDMEVFDKVTREHVAHHSLPYEMKQTELIALIKKYV